jgi:SAM-dependent methyltransferase
VDELRDYFDESVAATYDDDTTDEFSAGTIAATVDVLTGLAGAGSALELAIGTGRIAVPLAERGVRVVGIDLSPAMVARLRAKRADIPVTIGDIATTRVAGSFSLVYLVFNTLMNLTTQAAQVSCFATAAAHLTPGGSFVVECMLPELRSLPRPARLSFRST